MRATRAQAGAALLLLLSANMLIDALEVSTVAVALPAIGADFDLSPPATSWFMTAFAVGFGGSLLLGNWLTGRYGRRRIYLYALAGFAVASVAAALAPDPYLLAAARVVKGVCVALTAPTGVAIIARSFTEGAARNRALAVYSLFGASGFSVGLLLSGTLTPASWRWTLFVSGPAALVLYLVGLRIIPRDRPAPTPASGAPVGLAAVLRPALVRAAVGAAALNGGLWGVLLLATYELQVGLGWSPLATGVALLPTSVPLAVSAVHIGRLVGRYGTAPLILAGSLAALTGFGWYAVGGAQLGYPIGMLPALGAIGVGMMLSFSALHVQAVRGLAPSEQPLATALYQTSVQIGGALVLALVAAAALVGRPAAAAVVVAVSGAGLLAAIGGVLAAQQQRGRRTSWTPTRST